ncbi:MAG: MarR family transcriptional regulator [Pseudomonadota bacterium]|nr:MarR family transcriptional regulator [Pseudomonadota bacterium]
MAEAGNSVTDFSYDMPAKGVRDAAGLPARVAVFADDPATRRQIADDMKGAGFRALEGGTISSLLDGPITLLGDVVMVDCPAAIAGGLEASTLAALARLDMRVARSGVHLVVTTSLEALDDVFGALDQSQAQILVQPTRADRLVAVGRVMSSVSNGRVREMSEEDRISVLHLSQQVEAIAQQLERISGRDTGGSDLPASGFDNGGRVSDFKNEFRGPSSEPLTFGQGAGGKGGAPRALPDPKLVRQVIAARQARARFFDADLFADPAWDMLLDLTAARAEKAQVSVTSLCIAAGVPATTALRWLKQMVESGIFERVADTADRRRAFIELSDESADAMARYFASVEMPMALAA